MFNKIAKRVLSICLAASLVVTGTATYTGNAAKVKAANSFKDGWNIDIYMSASNLETDYWAASDDLLEMCQATDMPSNVQITIETGGAEEWHWKDRIEGYYKKSLGMTDETIAKINTQNISNKYIQRYVVKWDNKIEQDGKTITYPSLVCINDKVAVNDEELAKELGVKQASMGSVEVLSDFIRDTSTVYKHNVITFWNHGGGTTGGFCYDDLQANHDRLFLDEMEDAIKANVNNICNNKYDLISFDVCLLGNFEAVAVCSRWADYMQASMTLEGDDGNEYTDGLTSLGKAVKEGKTYTGADYAKGFMEEFIARYTDKNGGAYYPDANQAIYDLSYGPQLVTELDNLSKIMIRLMSDETVKEGFLQEAYKAPAAYPNYRMVSMYSLLKNTINYAKKYADKNANSNKASIKENVTNCNEYVEAATAFYNTLFESDFFVDYFTGTEESKLYNEHAISIYLPDTNNKKGTDFAKVDYAKLGISDNYALFAYLVGVDVMKNQEIPVATDAIWNAKTKKYDYVVTSNQGKFTADSGYETYVLYNNSYIDTRNFTLDMTNDKVSVKPEYGYTTFNGVPMWMSAYDEEYFNYYTYLNVNGNKTYIEFDYIDGEYVIFSELEEGDVVAPITTDIKGNTKTVTSKAYTIKESDFDEDGNLTLPMTYKKMNDKTAALRFYTEDMKGDVHEESFAHADTLRFANAKAKLAKKTVKATGKAVCPSVKVIINGKTLKKGTDYKVVYENNVTVGTAKATVVPMGKYKGAKEKVLTFKIKSNK